MKQEKYTKVIDKYIEAMKYNVSDYKIAMNLSLANIKI